MRKALYSAREGYKRSGKQYPLDEEPQRYPGVPASFLRDRGGALREAKPTAPVSDLPWEKSSYAANRNVYGLLAFREPLVDGGRYDPLHRGWGAWTTNRFESVPMSFNGKPLW